MLSHRFSIQPVVASVCFVVGLSACGGEPPPPARTASAARGGRVATGGSSTSLGDSALEPAAVAARDAEDWPQAEALYRELSRRQPRNADAKRGLGVALLRQQKNEPAIPAFEDSLKLKDDVQTRLDLAAAFVAMDRAPSALPHLRKAVQMTPQNPTVWTQLAEVLVKVDKPDGAAESQAESAKACKPCASNDDWNRATDNVARALTTKAEQQIGANDTTGARKSIDLAVRIRPELPEAHLAMGKVARASGDKKAAATAYRKAIDGLPDAKGDAGANARLELASLLLSDGGGAEAVKLAEKVVSVRGEDGSALDTLGRACDATRDAACARQAYGKLVKLPAGTATNKGALEHARLRMKELKSKRR
jgi:Flp pilus assembly protein TadD